MPLHRNRRYLISIRERIDKEYKKPLKIADLAEDAGVSQSKLKHEFSAVFGFGIQDYHVRCRISAAKDLLDNTDHPIKRIAGMVGYKNPESFTRAFLKISGMLPSKYRNSVG
jgi:AraC-like DNA-binding protein